MLVLIFNLVNLVKCMYYFICITLCVSDKSDKTHIKCDEQSTQPSLQLIQFLLLVDLIQNNHKRETIQILENWKTSGIHPDTIFYGGYTPLAFVISIGNIMLIDILIDYGSDISKQLSNGLYPIDYAKSDKVKNHLISKGAKYEKLRTRIQKRIQFLAEILCYTQKRMLLKIQSIMKK